MFKQIFKNRVYLVCLLLSIVLAPASHAAEELVDFDITGSWVSEPQLGQLGFVQVSYTFSRDGAFSQKVDFKSFCGMGAVTPDCDYFWNVSQGKYSLNGSVLKLHHEKASSHLSRLVKNHRQPSPPITSSAEIFSGRLPGVLFHQSVASSLRFSSPESPFFLYATAIFCFQPHNCIIRVRL